MGISYMGNGAHEARVQGVWAVGPYGAIGYRGMGYRIYGQWVQGVWATWGNRVQGVWVKGYGHMGQ